MTVDWHSTRIPGVLRRSVAGRDDARGSFRELWRASWTTPAGIPDFVQANMSTSDAGVLRGLHFHMRQTDMWIVLSGQAHVCLVDIRGRIATGAGSIDALADIFRPGDAVVIPEGVAHGFWALEPVLLLYLVTNEFDGTDEHGFIWNDADAAAAWPAGMPVLSERDRTAPNLAVAVATAQRSAQISSR